MQQTAASLARIPDGENRRFAALALAQCGDGTAKKLIDAETRPQDSVVQGIFVPPIEALNNLQKGDGSGAVALLEPARRYESATLPPNAPDWVLYTRGKAHLLLKEPDKAVAEFQKILDFRGRDATSELIPMAQLHLVAPTPCKAIPSKPAPPTRTS